MQFFATQQTLQRFSVYARRLVYSARSYWTTLGSFALCAQVSLAQEPLRFVATLPDFASIARHVGGEHIEVTSLLRGGEDPHFVEARPSFVKLLFTAHLLAFAGMDLELGYLPLLLRNARNSKILPGQPGSIDCSVGIERLEVPSAPVDRSMGDVHPYGNPHYWLDPLSGVAIAERFAEAFARARPSDRQLFADRARAFRTTVYERLAGAELAAKYDVAKLAILHSEGRLLSFLESQGDAARLGGWWGTLARFGPIKAVDDHNMWPYFARRFGVQVVGHMEPKPGIPPTTAHLQKLVEQMRAEGIRLIFSSPYYDPRHARFLAEATGAIIVPLAHTTGSRPGTGSYLEMIDYNVRTLREALGRVHAQVTGAPR